MRNLKLIIKQIIFNFKFILGNKNQLLLALIFPFCAIMLPVIFFSFLMVFPTIMQYSVIAPAGIVFASVAFGIKKSTLYQNLNTTSLSNSIFYIGVYLTMIFVGGFFFALTMIILTMLGQFHLLLTDFLVYDNSKTFEFWNMQIGVISLSVLETITVLFALSFFLIRIIKTQKTYYIILFILLILCIMFGSCLNDYFLSTLTLDNPDGTSTVFPFFNSNHMIYPKWLFIPSLLFPFYAPGQILSIISDQSLSPFQPGRASIEPLTWFNKSDYESIDWTVNPISKYDDAMGTAWRYDLMLITPLIQMVFYGTAGITTSKLIKNK